MHQCVHNYHAKSRDSNSANPISLRLVVDIFTVDFLLCDDSFRALGIHFDLNHPDRGKGPDVSFSLADFSGIWENLKYRDLLPPLIRDNHLTAHLFGLTEVPAKYYQILVNLYSKRKIIVREKGVLKKAYG